MSICQSSDYNQSEVVSRVRGCETQSLRSHEDLIVRHLNANLFGIRSSDAFGSMKDDAS